MFRTSTSTSTTSGPRRSPGSHHAPKVLREYAFDIDDNILKLPSRVKMLDTETNKLVYMPSSEFALKRTNPRYQEVPDSMAEFRDDPTGKHNYFKEAIEAALASGDFKGSDWETFVMVSNDPKLAKLATYPTARGHSPEQMLEGFKVLVDAGLIKYPPSLENLYPVSYPPLAAKFKGSMGKPSEAKAQIIVGLLNKLEKKSERLPKALAKQTTWSFSDDDFKNYDTVRKLVSENVGRWPNLRIVIKYTGAKPEQTLLCGTDANRNEAPCDVDAFVAA